MYYNCLCFKSRKKRNGRRSRAYQKPNVTKSKEKVRWWYHESAVEVDGAAGDEAREKGGRVRFRRVQWLVGLHKTLHHATRRRLCKHQGAPGSTREQPDAQRTGTERHCAGSPGGDVQVPPPGRKGATATKPLTATPFHSHPSCKWHMSQDVDSRTPITIQRFVYKVTSNADSRSEPFLDSSMEPKRPAVVELDFVPPCRV